MAPTPPPAERSSAGRATSAARRGDGDGEQHLLVAAAAGDQVAAGRLYDAYADALYGYGLQRLGDRELAEELVQRVLVTLWRRAGSYDPRRGPVRAFVFAIAGSTVVDLHRRAARRPRPVADVTDDRRRSVDDAAEQVVLAESVRAALARLSPHHRQVLELGYDHGLTQREIAARLQIPLGTVKSRTLYALKALRLACEELGVRP